MRRRALFIISTFIVWLPVFVIQKPVFMFYQRALAGDCSLNDYWQVMWHGLKLDCTIAGYLTAIPLLLTLISVWLPGSWLRKALKGYLLVAAILVSAIFAVDVALYGFWGFRMDASVLFYLRSPADAMASVPWGLACMQIVLFLLYTAAIYAWMRLVVYIAPARDQIRMTTPEQLRGTLVVILLGGLLFIPIRGSLTTSTANVGMVYFSQRQFLNHAAINPCFSLMASLSKQQDFASQFDFFPEARRAELFRKLVDANPVCLSPDSLPTERRLLNTSRPNILLIIMESFSANAIEALGGEADVTPNLNRLSQEGILFTNLYANSFRTDRGLVAVLNGYLAQPTTSIMKYPAKSQTLPSIARSLDSIGYQADMLYGGDINFTNMQSYFYGSGYGRITADKDFPLSSRLSKWGANDDITFSYLFKMISERPDDGKRPWLSTFLTLSSHEPFKVPFHHLEHPYLNSVAFTDSCIGSFIDKMKKLPVWKNTLVILVADHGFRYPDNLKDYEPRRFHIPMLWLGGAVAEPRRITTFANQTDLAATLMRQLGLPAEPFIFSKDILDPAAPHYAFYTFHNGFGMIDSTGVTVYDNESNRPLIEAPQAGSDLRIESGKALLQTLYDDLGSR